MREHTVNASQFYVKNKFIFPALFPKVYRYFRVLNHEHMETMLQLAARNTRRAQQIIQTTGIVNAWKSIGAEINLVGSLKMGLMMKHRDIDFHVYTPRLTPAISFQAITQLAANPAIKRIEYKNLIDTD